MIVIVDNNFDAEQCNVHVNFCIPESTGNNVDSQQNAHIYICTVTFKTKTDTDTYMYLSSSFGREEELTCMHLWFILLNVNTQDLLDSMK